jgi:hypothetical protein
LIPCCAAKAAGGSLAPPLPDPLASTLSDTIYAQLCAARRTALTLLRSDASLLTGKFAKNRLLQEGHDFGGHVTAGRYLSALERYTGNLYSVPGLRSALYKCIDAPKAPRVMILSALYGPLHPLSPIQDYNLLMGEEPARVWRSAFLPVLESYIRLHGIRSVVLLLGSATPYFRVASAAVSTLLHHSVLDEAMQYHVHDGNSRTTPLEHGRILYELLCGQQPTSVRIECRRIDAIVGTTAVKPIEPPTQVPSRPTSSTVNTLNTFNQSRMRRAPPPNASAAQVARVAALNALPRTPISPSSIATTEQVALSPQLRTLGAPDIPPSDPSVLNENSSPHSTRLRALLGQLMKAPDQGLPLALLLETGRLPERGVYFFLDLMTSGDPYGWRVCRVGTHAVSFGSKSTLRARLRAHLGTRSGSGNHRGSIFRLHVGNALLRRDQRIIPTWGLGSSAPPALRESEALRNAEAEHEQLVSKYIGQLRVLWLAVPDEPSPTSERGIIERNTIALLSREAHLAPGLMNGWLGEHSPRSEIRSSRLWNLNYIDDNYDPAFFAALESAVARTIGQSL